MPVYDTANTVNAWSKAIIAVQTVQDLTFVQHIYDYT